jgi:hypothetical protein
VKSSFKHIWHYLVQPDARQDAGFRKQAEHISYIGLRFLTGAYIRPSLLSATSWRLPQWHATRNPGAC